MLDAGHKSNYARKIQTVNTTTGLSYDVENQQADAVVRRCESVNASWLAKNSKSARDDGSQKRWYNYKCF
jgi:hypothetical protein